MSVWSWSDPRWKDTVGLDLDAAVREALRRAVHLRDELAERNNHATTEAVFLVDSVNHLADLLATDVEQLWERT